VDRDVKVSQVVFMRNSIDTRYSVGQSAGAHAMEVVVLAVLPSTFQSL